MGHWFGHRSKVSGVLNMDVINRIPECWMSASNGRWERIWYKEDEPIKTWYKGRGSFVSEPCSVCSMSTASYFTRACCSYSLYAPMHYAYALCLCSMAIIGSLWLCIEAIALRCPQTRDTMMSLFILHHHFSFYFLQKQQQQQQFKGN